MGEIRAGRVIACEIKAASAAPTISDARYLIWLRERLKDRFVGGVVFHTGPFVYSLGDQITAVPIALLWN